MWAKRPVVVLENRPQNALVLEPMNSNIGKIRIFNPIQMQFRMQSPKNAIRFKI